MLLEYNLNFYISKIKMAKDIKLNIIIGNNRLDMIILKYISLEKYVMAKVIFFDLGDTLEHQDTPGHHVLRDDAKDILDHINSLNHANSQSPFLGLVSDYELSGSAVQARQKYYEMLRNLRDVNDSEIASYFEPLDTYVTLSKDIGATKDEDLRLFMEKAKNKIDNNISFSDLIFITENCKHIDSANSLGIKTIFLKLNNNSAVNNGNNTISNLSESINLIEGIINN
jgi:FMN phosphatase YigB (HAD superfamily)